VLYRQAFASINMNEALQTFISGFYQVVYYVKNSPLGGTLCNVMWVWGQDTWCSYAVKSISCLVLKCFTGYLNWKRQTFKW